MNSIYSNKKAIIIFIAPALFIFTLIVLLPILFTGYYILTSGGPLHSTEVPSTLMYTSTFKGLKYGYGSSIAFFIVIECLFLTILVQTLFKLKNNKN
jgi:raffinose/stachyose/melibiose transport system permease protein